MFLRTRKSRLHHQTDPDNTPIHQYSPFGWHYLNPGGIDRPRLHNRNYGRLWHAHAATGNQSFRLNISQFLHPSLQFALQPFLATIAETHTQVENGISVVDIVDHYRKIKDALPRYQRDTLFAAVVNICRNTATFQEVKKIWQSDLTEQYVAPWKALSEKSHRGIDPLEPDYTNINALTTYCQNLPDTTSATSFPGSASGELGKVGVNVPPLPLAEALLHSAAVAKDPLWKEIFLLSRKSAWNTSPHYHGSLWSAVLRAAGSLADAKGVIDVLKEIISCNVLWQTIESEDYAIAINAVTADDEYTELKELLGFFPTPTVTNLRHRYVELRNAEKIPRNDKVFYHVHWLFRTRKPMHFLPRREYFDYKPSTSKTENVTQKKKIKDILQQRLELWKKDGTLPADYSEQNITVDDAKDQTIDRFKKEPWKKKIFSKGQT
ncbi:beta-tubulin [Perkinsela sp. CCAP 1560/4]|nr:beta-tubulin [Perkinsela sp. CCAP 1560/4]|eukprot:KNH06874.1 beta-tubulin [Perkinsela sp. CCAP 1560/4]